MEKFKFSTVNEYNINRFSKLLSNLNIVNFKISFNRNTYTIIDNIKNEDNIIEKFNILKYTIEEQLKILESNCMNKKIKSEYTKAFIRGCFMGGGTITDPSNKYHFEIKLNNSTSLNIILNTLKESNIKAKILNDSNTLYIKDGEEISKILAYIGASKNMLKFEQIRVVKDMKNNVNRLVNCETANMNKTIDASVEQIANIKKLKKAHKFEEMSEELKELANLREKNPNATLEQLGNMLKKPIGKSSVNNRFKKIRLAAEEIG